MNTRTNSKTLRLTQMALLVAVLLVMAYTPLGYLKTPGLEITFMMVPVVLGSILLGPTAGAILGGVFGLTSFGTCFGTSAFGVALFNISPILTFIVCVIPRILAGWIPGLVFRAMYNPKAGKVRKNIAFFTASLLGPILNTLLFMSALVICFYQTDFIQQISTSLGAANPLIFVVLFVGLNGVIEAAVGFGISGILSRALYPMLHGKTE